MVQSESLPSPAQDAKIRPGRGRLHVREAMTFDEVTFAEMPFSYMTFGDLTYNEVAFGDLTFGEALGNRSACVSYLEASVCHERCSQVNHGY